MRRKHGRSSKIWFPPALFEKLVEFRLESISKGDHEHGSLSVVLAIVKTDGTTKTVHLSTSFAILMS